jgi:hypothetical protein
MNLIYTQYYPNGLNNPTQLRRSVDMVYQRGSNYGITLSGDTFNSSLQLNVDLIIKNEVVGRLNLVPYEVNNISNTQFIYKFNIRPYDYLSNFIQSEHYTSYWLNDWFESNKTINLENKYPNNISFQMKYGYQYTIGNITTTEYTGGTPTNVFNHYTDIPDCKETIDFTASGYTNTGGYFDLVGGSFQMGRDRFLLPNVDQQIGSTVGDDININIVDYYRNLSPMSQYLFDGPAVPEMSSKSRFLTDTPRIQYIQENENYTLAYLNGQTGDRQVIEADFVVFELYNQQNEIVNYFYQILNWSGTTYNTPTGYTDTLQVFYLPVGPKDINMIYANIDWTDVAYYRTQIYYGYPTEDLDRNLKGPIGPISEAFWFYLKDCSPRENTRLVWLNQKGGYDYFTFTDYRNDVKKINKQSYDNRYFSSNISSADSNIGRTTKTFDMNVNREITLESEYLTTQQSNWLEQLFLSPQVYEMGEDFISVMDRQDKVYKDLKPVEVLSTEVQSINKNNRKLNKYRITLKYSDTYFTVKGF